MNRTLILIALLASPQLYADPYETAQRFTAGDVISAEVLNDILDRIELSLKDIERDDMIGTWDVTANLCSGSSEPGTEAGEVGSCTANYPMDGAETISNGLFAKREDTWTITAISGSDTQFNITSTNYNLIYNHGSDYTGMDLDDGNTHACAIGQNTLGCHLEHPAVGGSWGGCPTCDPKKISAYFSLERLSTTRIKLFWGINRGGGIFNTIIMDKTDVPPVAPTALSASLVGDTSAATVSLSWTINGSNATGGIVKRKSALAGSWSTLGTPSTGSYSDTDITLNNSYWYRVFATNADGTSVGSNVVKVNYFSTPPSINIPSTISIDENASNATSGFTTLWVSSAYGLTLTLTLGSQSPGNDASDFTLASDGELRFNATPDYENPADYDTNNIYDLTLTATDGTETVSQDFSVVVLNVSD